VPRLPGTREEQEEWQAKQKELQAKKSNTLFVKNMTFKTTDEQLKTHFLPFGRVTQTLIVICTFFRGLEKCIRLMDL